MGDLVRLLAKAAQLSGTFVKTLSRLAFYGFSISYFWIGIGYIRTRNLTQLVIREEENSSIDGYWIGRVEYL